MSLLDSAQLARHPGFRDRVLSATMLAAVQVAAEAPSGDTRKDNLRATLATNVLNDPMGYVDRMTYAVVANPAVTFEASDNDIQFSVNSVWDAVAGV